MTLTLEQRIQRLEILEKRRNPVVKKKRKTREEEINQMAEIIKSRNQKKAELKKNWNI